MKIIISILLTALLAYAVGIYGNLPWWCFVLTNLLVAIAIPQKSIHSFLVGFISIGLLWTLLAIGIDQGNNHLLSIKVANILPLKGSYVSLIVLTGFIGALVGGLASLTGSFVRSK
jgi:hypothetical protein